MHRAEGKHLSGFRYSIHLLYSQWTKLILCRPQGRMGPKEGLRTEIFWTLAETRKILTRKMDGLGKENQIVIAERIDWMIKEIQRWKDSLKEATENAEVIAHPRSPLAPGDLATADSRFPSYNVLPALPPSSLRSNGPRNLRDACWPPLFDTVSPTLGY